VDKSNSVLKIRVSRTEVHFFPFDLVYLVPIKQKNIISRLFPWSICIPPSDVLVDNIGHILIKNIELLPTHGRKKIQNLKPLRMFPGFFTSKNVLYQYFTLIPILPLMTTKKAYQNKIRLPGYLVAKEHLNSRNKKYSTVTNILTEAATLYTPTGPVRPICLACPRHMLNILGKCQIGCRYCMETLTLEKISDE
jgi:hypothetical protein